MATQINLLVVIIALVSVYVTVFSLLTFHVNEIVTVQAKKDATDSENDLIVQKAFKRLGDSDEDLLVFIQVKSI